MLTGKIKNWKEITGQQDLPVKLYLTKTASGTSKFLEQTFLRGEKLRSDGISVATSKERQKIILTTPGAFAFGNRTVVAPGMNVPKHPTIGRPITMIWKGAPSPKILKLLDSIAQHGK